MSGQAIENQSLRQLLPFNPTNGQIPIWNSTTLRWEAGANGGGFDPTANYNVTGSWTFTQKIIANDGLEMAYQAAPTGVAGKTTLYADATGKLAWRNGTGFIRTFDASTITANRTWTMPDADTTIAGLGVAQTYTAAQTISVNGAVSASAIKAIGTWYSGGSSTTTKPYFLIEPTGTTSADWSINGTGIGVNASSSFTGNMIDLQRDGATKFKVDRLGYGFFSGGLSQIPEIGLSSGGILLFAGRSRIKSPSSTTVMFQDSSELSAANIILGLQTTSFPMIKRNGAAIDFVLASDTGFCAISASAITISTGNIELSSGQNIISNLGAGATGLIVKANGTSSVALDVQGSTVTTNNIQRWRNSSSVTLAFIDGFGGAMFGGSSLNASAILQADSKTKGFLPPRMNSGEKNAIAAPAQGLVVFDTDLGKLCVYNATWETLTSL